MTAPLRVDLLLIGAGPVGLFGAYYAGFRGLRVAVMDSLPQVGGQVSALYPQKNIYDVAGFPQVKGQDLVESLVRQAAPFGPRYLLGQQAERLEHRAGSVVVTSSAGLVVEAGAVVITAGVGSASPRPLPCGERHLGRGLHYFVPDLDTFDGRDVVVVGGGDSAVDWALAAVERANSVRLVHRRRAFRAHEHSVARLHASTCELVLDAQVTGLHGEDRVTAVELDTGAVVPADVVVAALGFKLQLGPIASWGLALRDRSILVDAAMATSLPQVYAAGDIATHDGKVKLIAVGFGEVATAVNNAAAVLQPEVGLAPGHSSDAPPALLERV
ncbi:NAD(P)/FAD-dependent oxidoreductase [Amycolatopsis acidiphila]|uniref:Ferredoxin--NADP reductase n=1 Tax=Amycolatopsis acidiphila TaxID=715473 RepID=A0A558AL37_9PSEU|nr:NAD(P)/FAD-dependent oxidoreductase [Amycolatopsis acidiphila]TVT24973.1 NAD(P)/FAD-dependent oxidoreductase [Amycolatopsis acidiphila]UIJ57522.1 NAD(P)/FAD-dependent oxidoreductase [Amycolatopsis acidiphila]GHG89263.1 ferredoxin--NADP reductase [Amycolatopsis acidiphila]